MEQEQGWRELRVIAFSVKPPCAQAVEEVVPEVRGVEKLREPVKTWMR